MAGFQDEKGNAIAELHVRTGALTTFALWGGGPQGEALDVVWLPRLQLINEITVVNARAHTRFFTILPILPGIVQVRALCRNGDYAAPLIIHVHLRMPHLVDREFYHGTTLEAARSLIKQCIGPQSVPLAQLVDDSEYTDFGKGFYIHPPENRQLAIDWAKRHAAEKKTDWGVACFVLTDKELDNISGQRLLFRTKRSDRPGNAPKLFDGKPANWIEFVEFNRHVRTEVARPKDNDWTADYAVMRGPIWVRKDSNLPGKLPPFPENVHQINLGIEGLRVLNAKEAVGRRFVIDKNNV